VKKPPNSCIALVVAAFNRSLNRAVRLTPFVQVLQKLAVKLGMTLPAEASHPSIFAVPSPTGIRIRVEGPLVSRARLPLLVDGFIASAAALVAVRMNPAALECCFFAHQSAEAGHALLLEKLGGAPLLHLGLRLGEGTGAALAFPLLRAAARLVSEMATFESAGISEAHQPPQEIPR
jgi:nicotinate-nucleotide--dimethylbenzimidazole phosphoribosyltransferase